MRAGGAPDWRRRLLYGAAVVAATAFVGASIVVATIAGPPSRGGRPVADSGAGEGAGRTQPPRERWVRQRIARSPPRLDALHRQAAKVLEGDLGARLRRLRGYPIVLNAWASWCAPCRDELPLMARASARFAHRVAFVGADVDDSVTAARSLLAGDAISYPSYRASAAELRSVTPIVGFPTTIYLDRRGRPIHSHQGQYASEDLLAADIRRYALGR